MGVEVTESNISVPVEAGKDTNMSTENGKVNIMFGSHSVDEPVKGEVKKVPESNLPKDAVDEWPEPQQVHSFYIVRFRAFEDQNVKAKLDVAEKELQKKNQSRSQIIGKLKNKRAERSNLISQIRLLSVENKQFRSIMDEKRKEMEPLQQALGKLRGSSGGRDRSSGICSSEEELNDLIKSLQYRIQHESIPLSEEKQILREIKQLEGTREKVIANAAERARIQDSMGEKDAIQDQVKLIGVNLDEVRKEKQVVHAKLKQLDDEKLAIEKEIGVLEEELTSLTEKRDKIFENIKEMRKQRDEGNSPFYENRNLLTRAKGVAARKEVDALKELTETEVEKFLSLWNSNKSFRNDYERRALSSLDMRQLSKDGRMRNPEEKPLVQVVQPMPSEPEIVKSSVIQPPKAKEEDVSRPQQEEKAQEAKSGKNQKEANRKREVTEKIDVEEEEEVSTLHNSSKDSLPKKEVFDEKKLKELKREEELAKRNQAEERKKKLAEKAAAKAAIKAQKEAEKKLKEREKKAKKKSGAGASAAEPEEPAEAVTEDVEPENTEEKIETPVPQKKDRKENTLRHRGQPRGPDSIPKAILKRKKSSYNWMYWAAAPAAVVVLLLVVVGYNYLS